MQIEQAKISDLAAIERLQDRAFSPDRDWRLSRRALRYHLKKQTPFFLLRDGDHLVGYLLLFSQKRSAVARIYMLAVDPCCRGRGLGRRLLHFAKEWAAAHAKDRLSLEVRADNHKAHTLYSRFGFKRQKLLPSFYPGGRDGWRMVMKIDKRWADEHGSLD